MDIRENISVSLDSIKSNLLRSIITAAIITVGIMLLVGVLTAIEAMKSSISNSFSSLGANTIEITSKRNYGRSSAGKEEKVYPKLTYAEVSDFQNRFEETETVGLSVVASWTAEVKRGSKKTNPNTRVTGGDNNYLSLRGLNLEKGRNFTEFDIENGTSTAIIGYAIKESLFEEYEDPIGEYIFLLGKRFKVIGTTEEQGGLGGNNSQDRRILIPIETARRLITQSPEYDITINVSDPIDTENIMANARHVMRLIRQDPIGTEDSFTVERNETVAEELENIASYMRIGGFTLGGVTLLGAVIALMNIMLVSVTERTREIGLRKALGAKPSTIRSQFLIEAILICVIGGIGGIVAGALIGNIVGSLIGEGGVILPIPWIILGFVVCVGVGLIAGFIPANKASKLDPIVALRYE
ncbi:ABC transporter permease [Marinigracilibium pacificum]|uniref:FtsX-like permease family protein n=1 Tax=Marinigracilibium pacificum TaxID=2729599 RepID=A0A848IUE5_9BACT|nr:ABC transporter permease [Marinigracilibium pacificum]NMM47957.1 FtsX-like permease family protein [Marinigracilibium pacificum]